MAEQLYRTGDKIRIVNYGQPFWINTKSYQPEPMPTKFLMIHKEGHVEYYDMRPEIVGKEDIIVDSNYNQGRYMYSLLSHGAWFVDEQLELLSKNPNHIP